MADRNAFRKYLGQDSGLADRGEDADLFRSRRRDAADEDERDETVDYETGSRLRSSAEDVAVDDEVIDVKKSGKDLLFHNMISASVAGAARQVEKFFRRLIQR